MLLAAALLSLIPVGCGKGLNIDPPAPVPGGGGGDTPTPDSERPTEPTICTNKVVAHRGGSAECGQPDNSRASLKYAMSLKCYASECDIYWTKDNAKDKFFINGLRPWEHTVLEIRRAGKLTNGEEIPTLTDFLDIVQVKDNCTKLCLDIKNLEGFPDYPSKAVMRACEIIAARHAEKFCEFICTSNETVATAAAACQVKYGIPVGWMSTNEPSKHLAKGFTWANMCALNVEPFATGTPKRTIDQYLNAGMKFSVFNVDQKKGDSNAIYSEEGVAYYVSRYKDLRCICTNYPKWLLSKVQ